MKTRKQIGGTYELTSADERLFMQVTDVNGQITSITGGTVKIEGSMPANFSAYASQGAELSVSIANVKASELVEVCGVVADAIKDVQLSMTSSDEK